jgi:hypothetical protein
MTYASVEIPARHIRGHTAGWLRWHNKSGCPLFPYFSWVDRWKEEAWLIKPKKKVSSAYSRKSTELYKYNFLSALRQTQANIQHVTKPVF